MSKTRGHGWIPDGGNADTVREWDGGWGSAKGGRTRCMMGLQHPVSLAGRAINDEGAVPHDLDVTIASLHQGRSREALHVERAGWRGPGHGLKRRVLSGVLGLFFVGCVHNCAVRSGVVFRSRRLVGKEGVEG
jgi:hypothetical protein